MELLKIKPLKLTMVAFGAFVKKTEIDFSVLNKHSLFLITGPTGAGKTTILDAITFALFGEASGETRRTENFKSDYSDLKELCFVKLEFELKNKKYVIERYPKQSKISARKNIVVINSKAKLILEDGEEIIGTDSVNKKIIELLGITYKQFKQIVVLPQGEFKKLLEAKSEDKQDIFRKIFNTDLHEKFCKALLEKTKEIQTKIEKAGQLMLGYINSVDSFGDEELLQIILQFLPNSLNNNKGSVANVNILLVKLKENIRKNNCKANTIKEKINLLEKSKNDVNEKLVWLKIIEEKKLRLKEVEVKINREEKVQQELEAELQITLLKLKNASEKKDAISNLICEKNDLNNKLEYFKEIDNLQKEYKTIYNEKIDIIQQLNRLMLAEQKIKLKAELNINKELYCKFKELINSIDVYCNIFNEYRDLEKKYLIEYEKFLAGQAGFLAEKLIDNKPCPVCGSTVHPNKAKALTGTPSEEYVKNLALQAKKLREKLNNTDIKLFESYNFIKEKIVEFEEIDYKDILNNKNRLREILEYYKSCWEVKINEYKNMDINIDGTAIEAISDDIKKLQNHIIEINVKIESIKGNEEKLKLKIKDLISVKDILKKIDKIDEEINSIEKNYKIENARYQEIRTLVDKNNKEIQLLNDEIKKIKIQLQENGKNDITLNKEKLDLELKEIDRQLHNIIEALTKTTAQLNVNIKQYQNIKNITGEYEKLYAKYSDYASLADVASGKNPLRISFERYILASYFQDVINAANVKFSEMTGYRYLLKRKEEKEKNNRASGLDLEIIDNYTGKTRHVNTLSGGESFKASLCLALGLADVVQMYSGGVEIATLFIDEGFGTLDTESLDSAIEALTSLKKNGRLVGIISHVNELKERIPVKLIVKTSKVGSSLELSF